MRHKIKYKTRKNHKIKKFKTQKFGNKHKVDIHWSHSKWNQACAVHLKYDIGKWNNINESTVFMTVVLNYDAMEKMPEVFELRNLPIF